MLVELLKGMALTGRYAFRRKVTEAIWQSAEVDALYRLAAAGVRVPTPHNFLEGVLLMDLVTDAHGDAAPRLNDVVFSPEDAIRHHASLLKEVMRMLCAGIVHGDLSEFNALLASNTVVVMRPCSRACSAVASTVTLTCTASRAMPTLEVRTLPMMWRILSAKRL